MIRSRSSGDIGVNVLVAVLVGVAIVLLGAATLAGSRALEGRTPAPAVRPKPIGAHPPSNRVVADRPHEPRVQTTKRRSVTAASPARKTAKKVAKREPKRAAAVTPAPTRVVSHSQPPPRTQTQPVVQPPQPSPRTPAPTPHTAPKPAAPKPQPPPAVPFDEQGTTPAPDNAPVTFDDSGTGGSSPNP